MAQVSTNYEHIVLDKNKVPKIRGTRFKVVNIVASKIAHGWSPEEIHFQYPSLTLGQIHSALAYYHDHEQYFEEVIEKQLTALSGAQKVQESSSLIKRLKQKGLL